ncbi:MAG: GH3 auxin-responsive promoter family protein, partial [Dehalococcoidia bacterium]
GEWFKWQLDHSYQPKTVLLDEVEVGNVYEIVITNFHGGIMTRYRPGDLIKIISLRNERLNIDIPQMVFHSRADDLIDISGFGRLTEKIIWEAIENAGIPYTEWTVRKEIIEDRAVLHIYVEPGDALIASEEGVAAAVHDQLNKLDREYHWRVYNIWGDTASALGLRPIQVTFLPQGAFSSYIAQRQAEGAALGHLKPPHINPSDKVLSLLGTPEVAGEAAPVPEEVERAAPR